MKNWDDLFQKFEASKENKDILFRYLKFRTWIQEKYPNGVKFDDSDEDEREPYFGWCDVLGCENQGCSGGNAWRETGYWTVCSNHSAHHREGKKQPKMKKSAIKREKSRDENGYLPYTNTPLTTKK